MDEMENFAELNQVPGEEDNPYSDQYYADRGGMATLYHHPSEPYTLEKLTEIENIPPFLAARHRFPHHHLQAVQYEGNGLIRIDNDPLVISYDHLRSLRRAYHEAYSLQELNGTDHIVPYHSHSLVSSKGKLCLSLKMEYMAGKTVEEHLKTGFSIADAGKAIVDTIDATLGIGDQHLLHQDINPSNLIYRITAERGKGSTTLIDFGISKKLGGYKHRVPVPQDIQLLFDEEIQTELRILGTPRYVSPEQARGEEQNQPSDWFSIGLVAYELLTGERLFSRSQKKDSHEAAMETVMDAAFYTNGRRDVHLAWMHYHYNLDLDLVRSVGLALDEDPERREILSLREHALKLAASGNDTLIHAKKKGDVLFPHARFEYPDTRKCEMAPHKVRS